MRGAEEEASGQSEVGQALVESVSEKELGAEKSAPFFDIRELNG